MSADDSHHHSTGADPRQGDLLELLDVTEAEHQQYRDARQGAAAGGRPGEAGGLGLSAPGQRKGRGR